MSEPEPGVPPNLISEDDISATERGSPEHGLLLWWRAFQFGDGQALAELTGAKTLDAVGENKLVTIAKAIGSGSPGIEVESAHREGDEATVRAFLISFDVDENGVSLETSRATPITFEMIHEDGKWRFDSSAYLDDVVAQQLRLEQQDQ